MVANPDASITIIEHDEDEMFEFNDDADVEGVSFARESHRRSKYRGF
jgi:hypothetical protein